MINFIFIFALFFPQVWFTSLFFSFTGEKKPFYGTHCNLNTSPHTWWFDGYILCLLFIPDVLKDWSHDGGWTCHCWFPTNSVRPPSSTSYGVQFIERLQMSLNELHSSDVGRVKESSRRRRIMVKTCWLDRGFRGFTSLITASMLRVAVTVRCHMMNARLHSPSVYRWLDSK